MHRPVATPARERSGVIHPDTRMGMVSLRVRDLRRVARFYEQVLGLSPVEEDGGRVTLGVPDGPALIDLHQESSAPARNPRSPGLFHLAVLMPDRQALALALARLAAARWPLDGASDHLVSEALYLSDPEGNGIEIYRDRPRDQWEVRDGQLAMATLPLDLDSLIGELGENGHVDPHAPAGTAMGHVHLQVSDLGQAEEFYVGVLGFEVMVRGYPGALFVSAGGYHHHLGLNTWHSAGSPPAPPGSAGLRHFEVVLPAAAEVEKVLDRARDAGVEAQPEAGGHLIRDPFGNGVLLRAG
jgi:catechol 2,3-dioxygenase